MKFKIFCMLSVIALSSCNNKNDSDVVSMRYVHKYGFDVSQDEWAQRDKDGQVVTTFKNGVTKNTSYKNGILHGPTTLTFPNTNVIQEKCEYNEGTLVKRIIFEISGLPVEETVYEMDGKKIITLWNNHGVPLSMEEYNGALLMSARYYTSQNEIEASVIEGNGTRIKRDRSEFLLAKEKIENGQVVKRTTFHPNGAIHTQCSFVDYRLHGVEETFSPSGALLSRINWNMGQLDGVQTTYKNKRIHTEITYVNGQKHGVEKEYDVYGLITKEINWVNDQRHGTSRYTTKDSSDMQWFWRGTLVERKKYQMLKFREELIAQANGEKPIKPSIKKDEQIVFEDEMSIKSEEDPNLMNSAIADESQKSSLKEEVSSKKEEKALSLSDIKAEIKALKELQQKNKLAEIKASKKIVKKTEKKEALNLKNEKAVVLKPKAKLPVEKKDAKKEIAQSKEAPKESLKVEEKKEIVLEKNISSTSENNPKAEKPSVINEAKEIVNLEKTSTPENTMQINEKPQVVKEQKEVAIEKPLEKSTEPSKDVNTFEKPKAAN